MEVAEERLSWLDGDDGAAVLPDAVEERRDEPRSFPGLMLELPDAAEVCEQLLCLVETRVARRSSAGELLLQCLTAQDVLALRKVAHHIEVAQPLKLPDQLTPALGLHS